MEGTEHDKTFFYRHKVPVVNLLLMAFILGVDPEVLLRIPGTEAADYYTGVVIVALLFMEFGAVWYKSLSIFSFSSSMYTRVPGWVLASFVPRVLVSGAIATLAVDAMGGFHVTEFFLVPIVLYAVVKEFWVRSVLFQTEREKGPRPNGARIVAGEVMLFFFIAGAYLAIWKVYLLEAQHIMFLVMSPINWPFAALAFGIFLYALEMPLLWEEHLKPKTAAQKRLAYLSLLLPVLALLGRFYLQSYLRG